MKSIRYFGYGHDLKIMNVPIPVIKENEVLVKVKAASINIVDIEIWIGRMRPFTGKKMPRGMGTDFSGIVDKVGSRVRHLSKGDAVFGWVSYKMSNTFSEYAVAREELTWKKPTCMSFEASACIPMDGCTSYKAICSRAKVKHGMNVLVHNASNVVGYIAVQICKSLGASVHCSALLRDFEKIKKLGVENVFSLEKKTVSKSSDRYDIVFDSSGTLKFSHAKKIMTPIGKYITSKPNQSQFLSLLTNRIRKKKNMMLITTVRPEYLKPLQALAEKKQLDIPLKNITPFPQSIKAIMQYPFENHETGKHVITLDELTE